MLVRTAVLKGKDPQQILEEMEIIDKQGVVLLSLCHYQYSEYFLSCLYYWLYNNFSSSLFSTCKLCI